MKKGSAYWIGPRPTDGKRWAYTSAATVINVPQLRESILHMQRRYVKQWNDIELDCARALSEHTHQVHGAQVIGGSRRFILHGQDGANHWILEVLYARSFSEFHPGWSCGKNPFRSTDDMRRIELHWHGDGRARFERWLDEERAENESKGEATQYLSLSPRQRRNS